MLNKQNLIFLDSKPFQKDLHLVLCAELCVYLHKCKWRRCETAFPIVYLYSSLAHETIYILLKQWVTTETKKSEMQTNNLLDDVRVTSSKTSYRYFTYSSFLLCGQAITCFRSINIFTYYTLSTLIVLKCDGNYEV